jgi:hypothetical protein
MVVPHVTAATTYTTNALKRWSCDDRPLPPIESIRAIHIYDFDNTLFCSPLPNRALWLQHTYGALANPDIFINGGWWHDVGILSATGDGVELEEPRAWAGWWNEKIVELVEMSMAQADVLTVLLTGRGEANFSELIKRMCRSKKLVFDMTCLKPLIGPEQQKFSSTMSFKQELIKSIVYTYSTASEVRIYEDRPNHVHGFKTFFAEYNSILHTSGSRVPLKELEVIEVQEKGTTLDPIVEVAEIQRMVNDHNTAIRHGDAPKLTPMRLQKNISYTAYMISAIDSNRLLSLISLPKSDRKIIRKLANSILISARQGPAAPAIMKKVGALGTPVRFQVTAIGNLENKLWAARVEPVNRGQQIHIEGHVPLVVLAIRVGTKPADSKHIRSWQSLSKDKMFQFEAVVGEKFTLNLEKDPQPSQFMPPQGPAHLGAHQSQEEEYEPQLVSLGNAAPGQDGRQGYNNGGNYRGGNVNRGPAPRKYHTQRKDAPARGRENFQRGGGVGRGRGRGAYRSLDDMGGGHQGRSGYTDYDAPKDGSMGMYNAY